MILRNVDLRVEEDHGMRVLDQLSKLSRLPSFQLTNLDIPLSYAMDLQILEELTSKIKNIRVIFYEPYEWREGQLAIIKESLSNSNVFVKKVCVSSSKNLNLINAECAHPTEMDLDLVMPLNLYEIREDIYNVTKLRWTMPHLGITYFKCLKELTIHTFSGSLLEAIIETNKKTLLTLTCWSVWHWEYNLPCQLKKLRVINQIKETQFSLPYFIQDQRFLRSISLHAFYITDDILFILRQNELLTSLTLSKCAPHYDFSDSLVFPNVQEIVFEECQNELLEGVWKNCENLTTLKIKGFSFPTSGFYYGKLPTLGNLKNLIVEDPILSEFFNLLLIAPNLEYLNINLRNWPPLLRDRCAQLKTFEKFFPVYFEQEPSQFYVQ